LLELVYSVTVAVTLWDSADTQPFVLYIEDEFAASLYARLCV